MEQQQMQQQFEAQLNKVKSEAFDAINSANKERDALRQQAQTMDSLLAQICSRLELEGQVTTEAILKKVDDLVKVSKSGPVKAPTKRRKATTKTE